MFTVALFITAKRWKQPKCLSIDEWINIMWCIYTVEYYSALKRKKILIHGTMWTNLKDIKLNEIRHKKDKYCMIPLT